MKIEEKFVLFEIITTSELEICVPSTDSYGRVNDWGTEYISTSTFKEIATSSSKEELLSLIKEEGEYYILSKYIASNK